MSAACFDLIADVLGGEVVREGYEELRAVGGPFAILAGTVLHFATPAAGADAEVGPVPATYHAITWKVADLDRVAKHLTFQGVRIARRSDTAVVTDPTTSLGIPWGFTTVST
ncbi:hypothetical protein AB0G32_13200 [Streptomyces sp. NPDC023723]|uniref:hypothetical protein n=1 Tax=Streptomyces sp. NPDC023723 TaxID=3154323 RepID=UPI0033C04B54